MTATQVVSKLGMIATQFFVFSIAILHFVYKAPAPIAMVMRGSEPGIAGDRFTMATIILFECIFFIFLLAYCGEKKLEKNTKIMA